MDTQKIPYAAMGVFVGFAVAAALKERAMAALLGAGTLFAVSLANGPGAGTDPEGDIAASAATTEGEAGGAPGGSAIDPSVDAKIRHAIAYCQHYGYAISDRGGYYSATLMTCDPMGAVAYYYHGECGWQTCDFQRLASEALGQSLEWVDAFHNGFKKDPYNYDMPDVYALGLAYRQEYMGS